MKRIYTKVFKSKKPYLGSKHGAEPATSTSTSTLKTGTTDLMPSVPQAATASTQVIAGVSVSTLAHRIFMYSY